MKIQKNQAFCFEKVGVKGWVYLGKDDFARAGVCFIKVEKGHQTIIKSTKSAWLYFIIEGKGKFVIKNNDFPCQKEDLLVIPKNTPFYYQGRMKMLLITVPAWEEKYEVTCGKTP